MRSRAIATMQVRGAPLIGAAAAYGMWLAMRADPSDGGAGGGACGAARDAPDGGEPALGARHRRGAARAVAAGSARCRSPRRRRPRSPTRTWPSTAPSASTRLALFRAAAARRRSGEPLQILTHCNAGWLATVDCGTALAGVYAAHDAGLPVHVWVDETRPRNQGAALTAWELGQHGVPHTVIVDNAGGHLMQRGRVDLVIVGTDRTTADRRRRQQDRHLPEGARRARLRRPLLRRRALAFDRLDDRRRARTSSPSRSATVEEVATISGVTAAGEAARVRVAPPGSAGAATPGFDVTPARLVTGIITERGVAPATREGSGAALSRARRRRGGDRRPGAPVTRGGERRALVETVRWLMARGLYAGTSGNVSARAGAGILITPTGIPCDDVDAASIVELTLDGAARGPLAPSSEWRIHRDIYRRRPEVGAVVHTHSTFATALSCLRRPMPAFHYMVAKAGGDDDPLRPLRDVRDRGAVAQRPGRAGGRTRACLLANHGLLALGARPRRGARSAPRRSRRSRPSTPPRARWASPSSCPSARCARPREVRALRPARAPLITG